MGRESKLLDLSVPSRPAEKRTANTMRAFQDCRSLLLPAIALAALCMALRADDPKHVGNTFPALELEGLSQTKAKSFDDYLGRTVLVVFFAYWGGGSGEHVPHMNELHLQFEAKGLSVVGVTIDRKDRTEAWMVENNVKYAIGYDKGGKFQNQLGITRVPQGLLIDPFGKVVWEGLPQNLESSVVEKALAGAFTTPVWNWPASAKPVRAALVKHKYGDALVEANKLAPADLGPVIVAEIQGLISARVQTLKALYDAGNLLEAQESANDLAKEFEGLPELAEAQKMQDALKANKDAERIIRGQKSVREIKNGKLSTAKDIDEAMAKLEKLAKVNAGTIVEVEVKALLDDLTVRKRANK